MSKRLEPWFSNAVPRSEGETRFLSHLRELARDWASLGLVPARSDSVSESFLMIGVELPHLTAQLRWLWVLGLDEAPEFAINCQWGDHTRYDDWGPIDGNIFASGSPTYATPELAATRAHQWITDQAHRKVTREDWVLPQQRSRWTFSDTGAPLFDTSLRGRRRFKDPDSIQTEQIDH